MMKKLNSVIAVMFSALLLTLALCNASLAAEWNNKFSDVPADAWYYDAVSYTCQKGIFSGISDNLFSPEGEMTRSMFVTVLARTAGANVEEYTGVSFRDVTPGAWYAKYVEWAYQTGVSSGVDQGVFGVENTITRQEMVTLFYNNLKSTGADVTVTDSFKYDHSADTESIADWANEAMRWALANGIISGTGNEGTFAIVAPQKTATRAEAARIIMNYLDYLSADDPFISSMTINNNPVFDYRIVYSANMPSGSSVKKAAKLLAGFIEETTGTRPEVVTDAETETDYEILVGATNRENNGIEVKRDGADAESFEISVQGNKLVIAGKSDLKGYDGTLYGVYGFAQEILGYEFYADDITEIKRQDEVNIAHGYYFSDGPKFEYRVVYWGNIVSDSLRTGGTDRAIGSVHNIGELTETGNATSPNPCLSDETNIQTAIKNVRAGLLAKPDANAVWVSQNDTQTYCTCERCMRIYREEGSRAGTLIRFCNAIAQAIDEEYPQVDIWTLAYHYTTIPTKTAPEDSVVIYYCTLDNCASHTYNDPDCFLNLSILSNIEGWGEKSKKVYVWDYSTNFRYCMSAFPIMTTIRENMAWFYENNVRGEFNNAIDSKSGEFGALKANMLAKLEWDPTMSEEEYNEEINSFLEAYYGSGWRYIRRYIDKTEELFDKNHYGYYAVPYAIISDSDMLAHEDEFNALWDAAQAGASNSKELLRIQCSRLSFTYMMLNAQFGRDVTNGNDESRYAYEEKARALYEDVIAHGVRWSEDGRNLSFDLSKPPYMW